MYFMDTELAYHIREVLQENNGKAHEEVLLENINMFTHELDEALKTYKKKGFVTVMGSHPNRKVYLEDRFMETELDCDPI